jgi:eukaryotic-like serine/threonine-protein kinase
MTTTINKSACKVKVTDPRVKDVDSGVIVRRTPMNFKYGTGERPLEGYSIRRGLGIGGFGEVYLAVTDAGKEVAIKQVRRNLDVELRGASQCLNLRHPNLVDLLDIRQSESDFGWIVMEYVAGKSLRELLDESPNGLSSNDVMTIFGQLGAGVHYLHEQGIVHRDLKPANVFIENGLVKIGDYGLAKFISKSQRGGQTESVGTFHYMAPEIGNGQYGKEIDVYSLGILLFEMLTGSVPFDGESPQEIILKHLASLPDLSPVPINFRDTIARALHKDPQSRFHSVADMLKSLNISIDRSGMAVQPQQHPERPHATLPSWDTIKQHLGLSTPVVKTSSATVKPKPAARHSPIQPASSKYAGLRPVRYAQEPIANAVLGMFAEIQRWFGQIPHNSPWYGAALAIVIVIVVARGVAVLPFIATLLLCYIPYFIVWSLVSSYQPQNVMEQKIGERMAPLPIARVPAGVDHGAIGASPPLPDVVPLVEAPISSRKPFRNFAQRQSHKRAQLLQKATIDNWIEWTWSVVSSTTIVSILSVFGYLVAIAVAPTHVDSSHFIAAGTWTAVMTLIMTWTVLFIGKRWERRNEDGLIFRFTLLTVGLGVGAVGYGLSEFLQVPWGNVTYFQRDTEPRTWPRFHNGLTPLLPAFMAYFAMLMGLVKWWRQSDILRRHRFSVFSVLWAILASVILSGFVFFPTPWCLIVAGVTSLALQMSTPWIDSKQERL